MIKFKYITIVVEDIEESTKFYEEILGLEKIEEYEIPEKFHMIMLSDGENIIELVENGKHAHISNIGLEVEDIDTVYQLKNKGIVLDKNEEYKLVTLKDPNGIEIVISEKSKK